MNKGDSISNAIMIDENDYISCVIAEHNYINKLYNCINNEIESVEQELVIDNGRKYDVLL